VRDPVSCLQYCCHAFDGLNGKRRYFVTCDPGGRDSRPMAIAFLVHQQFYGFGDPDGFVGVVRPVGVRY
jgi:hypothetical protein